MKRISIIIILIVLIISCSSSETEPVMSKLGATELKPDKEDSQSPNQIFTVKSADSMGVAFKHNQIYTKNYNIHETMGSGLAAIDIDNDGVYEVFFSQFDKNETNSEIYRYVNNRFVNITVEAGLEGYNHIMGAAVADVNNDGWSDLLIYGYKQFHMMINEKGVFVEIKIPDISENSFYTGATFFNANDDNYLDIWLNRYLVLNDDNHKICNGIDGLRQYCAPSTYPFQEDILMVSQEGLSFEIAGKSIVNIQASPSLGVVAADLNNDNLQDIYVANDGQYNHLFTQQANGTFIEEAQEKSLASNISGQKEASMGIAIGDYDNNGLIDLFITHLDNETNTLYKNEDKWFTDVTNQALLASTSRRFTGWGTGLYDLNGDNWLDIFVINGRVQPKAYQSRNDLVKQLQEHPLLYINDKQKFIYKDELKDIKTVGRGLAFVDFDNDGDKDLISNNNNNRPLVFLNNSNPIKWHGLVIKCHNRIDIGAKVQFTVKDGEDKQGFYRAVHADGSYASSNDPRIIISLKENQELIKTTIKYSTLKEEIFSNNHRINQYTIIDCEEK